LDVPDEVGLGPSTIRFVVNGSKDSEGADARVHLARCADRFGNTGRCRDGAQG
jgi:hypothetical protein